MKRKMNRLLLLALCLALLVISSGQAQQEDLRARSQQALAQLSGELVVSGLSRPVKVLRDEWGIAHIYAETQDDLFFAQGFVAAQDRLWQMDLWRRTGEGKLTEILGPAAIERDRFARLLRYRGNMEAEYKSYAPDAREIIAAFVRGVNHFIATTPADRLPIEFQLTGTRPEPWTPEVCLTRMAGYVMTRNASTEVLRAQIAREMGTKIVDELMPADPWRALDLPQGLDLNGIDGKIMAAANAAGSNISFAERQNDGSNNWVVDGTMTSTGKPLLANDPHRTIALPSLRYMVHLVGPGWNVIGAGEPALPGVAAGHNERVGFGFTIVGIDQQDLYVEEINPANPREYRWRGGWRKMRVEREQMKVKGENAPREIELKFTHHGPVIYEDKERHRAYSLRWVGSEPGTAGYLASLSLNRARNWREFLQALKRWQVPSENLVYADVDGNIGWVAAGMTPVRRGWSGMTPVPGSEGRYEWQGFLPLSALPQSYNPASHFIATANHNILPPGYRRTLGYEWSTPFRFQRIVEVLRGGRKFGIDDFERLHYDEVSLPARELTGLLKKATGVSDELKPYLELLTSWDATMSKDSGAAALYEFWQTKIAPAVFKRHVPEKVWPLIGERISLVTTIKALKNPTARWFGENPASGRDKALLASLAEAVNEAKAKLGADLKEWRWGRLHSAPFTHQLATDAERRAVFNLPSVITGGDANTVRAASGGGFRHTHGASFREILDPGDWDRSVATNVPGQSAQPTSPHYGDLLPLWAEGKYFPLLYSKEKVEAGAKNQLILRPGD
jgi:penicillin amidase